MCLLKDEQLLAWFLNVVSSQIRHRYSSKILEIQELKTNQTIVSSLQLDTTTASWTPLECHPGYWGLEGAFCHSEDDKTSGGWLSSATKRVSEDEARRKLAVRREYQQVIKEGRCPIPANIQDGETAL